MNAKIVGRKREQARLAEAFTSHRSELVAIYGRRRIRKTVRHKSVSELRGVYLLVNQFVVFSGHAVAFKSDPHVLHSRLNDVPPLPFVAVIERENFAVQNLV